MKKKIEVKGEYIFIKVTNADGQTCEYQIKVEDDGLILDRVFDSADDGMEELGMFEHGFQSEFENESE
jgi:hypothetical protein